jgi:hypothetical protein
MGSKEPPTEDGTPLLDAPYMGSNWNSVATRYQTPRVSRGDGGRYFYWGSPAQCDDWNTIVETASTTVTAPGQTNALAHGVFVAIGAADASERYCHELDEARRLAVPPIARAALAIIAGYITVQPWFRAVQVWAVSPAFSSPEPTPPCGRLLS